MYVKILIDSDDCKYDIEMREIGMRPEKTSYLSLWEKMVEKSFISVYTVIKPAASRGISKLHILAADPPGSLT